MLYLFKRFGKWLFFFKVHTLGHYCTAIISLGAPVAILFVVFNKLSWYFILCDPMYAAQVLICLLPFRLDKGVIVYICDSRGVRDIYDTDGSNAIAASEPLAVLVYFCIFYITTLSWSSVIFERQICKCLRYRFMKLQNHRTDDCVFGFVHSQYLLSQCLVLD